MVILLFVSGILLLILGAESLVRGASRLAAVVGISPLIVGLTVVAFGTSAPELAVSVKAAMSQQTGIALGNVVGSNIFNVLFILGLSALIGPLVVSQQLVRLDVPLMIVVSIVVWVFGLNGLFSRTEGVLLITGLVLYVGLLICQSRREPAEVTNEYAEEFGVPGDIVGGWVKNIGFVLGGLVLLVLGSRWLVASAVSIARYLGVHELVVGLTIVAAGTSLPEVVTSVVASIRGERDIAVGNVVGSNLFNIMGVLGVSIAVAPAGIEVSSAVTRFDMPIMIAVAFACLPVFFTGGRISRLEGGLFLGYYVAYTLYFVFVGTRHDALPWFSAGMLYFVIPLTVVTLAIVALREFRNGRMKHPDSVR